MNLRAVERLPDDANGTVVRLPGGTALATGVRLPADVQSGLCLGLRPEALPVAASGPLQGTLEVIERLGDRTLLHVALPDGTVCVADGRQGDDGLHVTGEPRIGDTLHLQPDTRRLRLCDADDRAHRAAER